MTEEERKKALIKQGFSDLEIIGQLDFDQIDLKESYQIYPQKENVPRDIITEMYYRFWAEGETPEFLAAHYSLPEAIVLKLLEPRNWHDEVDTRIWDYLREGQPDGDGTVVCFSDKKEDTEEDSRIHTLKEI